MLAGSEQVMSCCIVVCCGNVIRSKWKTVSVQSYGDESWLSTDLLWSIWSTPVYQEHTILTLRFVRDRTFVSVPLGVDIGTVLGSCRSCQTCHWFRILFSSWNVMCCDNELSYNVGDWCLRWTRQARAFQCDFQSFHTACEAEKLACKFGAHWGTQISIWGTCTSGVSSAQSPHSARCRAFRYFSYTVSGFSVTAKDCLHCQNSKGHKSATEVLRNRDRGAAWAVKYVWQRLLNLCL